MGRVTYEQSGETFFLPFALEDIEGGQKIQAGDTVEFYISTDERLVEVVHASCILWILSDIFFYGYNLWKLAVLPVFQFTNIPFHTAH